MQSLVQPPWPLLELMRSLALEGDEVVFNPSGVLGRKCSPKWLPFPPKLVCDGCGNKPDDAMMV